MSRSLSNFDKWNMGQKRIVPSNTGRFHTLVDSERKRAWEAATDMVYAKFRCDIAHIHRLAQRLIQEML